MDVRDTRFIVIQRIRLAASIVSAAVCRSNRSLHDRRSPRGVNMAAAPGLKSDGDDTGRRSRWPRRSRRHNFPRRGRRGRRGRRDRSEARQPSVVVYSEQAPRYPFSGRKGRRMGPLNKHHPTTQDGDWRGDRLRTPHPRRRLSRRPPSRGRSQSRKTGRQGRAPSWPR